MRFNFSGVPLLAIIMIFAVSCSQTRMLPCPDFSSDRSATLKQKKHIRSVKYAPPRSKVKTGRIQLVRAVNVESRIQSDHEEPELFATAYNMNETSLNEFYQVFDVKIGNENAGQSFRKKKFDIASDPLPFIKELVEDSDFALINHPARKKGSKETVSNSFLETQIDSSVLSDRKLQKRPWIGHGRQKEPLFSAKTLAVLSFVCTATIFFPFIGGITFLPGIVLAIVSLIRYRTETDKSGRGFAVAAIVIGSLVLAFLALFLVVFLYSNSGNSFF